MLQQSEKNLREWHKVFGLKADRESLQNARARECRPEFLGGNRWRTESATHPGEFYRQQVFFTGISDATVIGYDLYIACDCPAIAGCKHQIAVETKYHANWGYYFDLFDLPRTARFSELHELAMELNERIEADEMREAA